MALSISAMVKSLVKNIKSNRVKLSALLLLSITVLVGITYSSARPVDVIDSNTTHLKVEVPLEPIEGQTILRFSPSASNEDIENYLKSANLQIIERIPEINSILVQKNAEQDLPESMILETHEADYYISIASMSFPTNDEYAEKQWGLEAIDINSIWTNENIESIKKIAVIDSGVCLDHPDLENKILAGYDFIENDNIAQDEFGHGCGVAGVIASNSNNKIGIAGVSQYSMIMPIRVLDGKGIGTYSDVAAGIIWATNNGADVINLSLGGYNESGLLLDAVNYAASKDVQINAAAGNTGTNQVLYPAAYESVVAVGAVGPKSESDTNYPTASFSSTGAEIDSWAPGVDIVTTDLNGRYQTLSGTSLAVPFVSAGGNVSIIPNVSTSENNINTFVAEESIQNSSATWCQVHRAHDTNTTGDRLLILLQGLNTNYDGYFSTEGFYTLIRGISPLYRGVTYFSYNINDNTSYDTSHTALGVNNNHIPALKKLIDACKNEHPEIKSVDLIGHSQGGYTAFQFVLKYGYDYDGYINNVITLDSPVNGSLLLCEVNASKYSPSIDHCRDSGLEQFKQQDELAKVAKSDTTSYINDPKIIFEMVSALNVLNTSSQSGFDMGIIRRYTSVSSIALGNRNALDQLERDTSINVTTFTNSEEWVIHESEALVPNHSYSMSLGSYGAQMGHSKVFKNENFPAVNSFLLNTLSESIGYCSVEGISAQNTCSDGTYTPPPTTSACPANENGDYCGGTSLVGGDANTLYSCTNGVYSVKQSCSNGCIQNSQGVADVCADESVDFCSQVIWGGAGNYCKGDVLVTCGGDRKTVDQVQCGYGCQINALGTPDICLANPEMTDATDEEYLGSVKLFKDSNYSNLDLEVSNIIKTSNEPTPTIYSIEIPEGWSVRLYDQDEMRGASSCFNQSVSNLQDHEDWQNRIESIEIFTEDVCAKPQGPIWEMNVYDGDSKWWDRDIPSETARCTEILEGEMLNKDFADSAPCGGGTSSDNWVAEFIGTRNFEEGEYVFTIKHDDGLQIFIDGKQTLIRSSQGESTICDPYQLSGDVELKFLLREEAGNSNIDISWTNDTSACKDITPPNGQMISPKPNTYNNSTSPVLLEAKAFDESTEQSTSGVSLVEFYAKSENGWNSGEWTKVGENSTSPYQYYLDTQNLPEGIYFLSANVYDTGGNQSGILEDESAWTYMSIDRTKPIAKITNQESQSDSFELLVKWEGIDNITVKSELFYNVQYQTNCIGDWEDWIVNKPITQRYFSAMPGGSYCFRVQAIDLANNIGEWSNTSPVISSPVCDANQFLAEYFPNKELSGLPTLIRCENVIDHNWGEEGPLSEKSSTGIDGDLIVEAGLIKLADENKASLNENVSSGNNTIKLSTTNGFNKFDEILIIQMSGTEAGTYEFANVQDVNNGSLILEKGLTNSYFTGGNSRVQIVRVPNYQNVQIDGTLTTSTWDGKTGGILVFRAESINVSATGLIDVSGKGFTGGPGGNESNASRPDTGSTGASYLSPVPLNGPVAPAETMSPPGPANGGGGTGGQGSRAQDAAAGGGGGSYGTKGLNGENAYRYPYAPGGKAGQTYGVEDLSQIYLGSGGGGGGKGKDGAGASGGNGGGIIMLFAKEVTSNGQISSMGQNAPHNWKDGQAGGGGGGAGGSILIRSNSISITSTSVNGGKFSNGIHHHGSSNGGMGGNGISRIEYCESNQGVADAVQSCSTDFFSARWTGTFDLTPNKYKFISKADDGARLFINNEMIIDDWVDSYSENTSVKYAGSKTNIRYEYYENTGEAEAHLNIVPGTNNPPIINEIPIQEAPPSRSFDTLKFYDYGYDPDLDYTELTFSGADNLILQVDEQNNIVVENPNNWIGEETITFTLTDTWGESTSRDVIFRVIEYKTPSTPTFEGYNIPELSILPNEQPLDFVCSASTNSTKIAANWSKVEGIDIIYQLELMSPDGEILSYYYSNSYSDFIDLLSETNVVSQWFSGGGSGAGNIFTNAPEPGVPLYGLWQARVRAIEDVDLNGSLSSGDLASSWSTLCNIDLLDPMPQISNIPDQITNEDEAFEPIELDSYVDSSYEGELIWSFTPTNNLQVTLEGSSLLVNPVSNWNGEETLTINVTNENEQSLEKIITFKVSPVNDAPIISSDPIISILEDSEYSYRVEASDIDGDTLIFKLVSSPQEMNIDSNGLITWNPKQVDVGTHLVSIEVSDGEIIVQQQYTLIVENVNDAPTAPTNPDPLNGAIEQDFQGVTFSWEQSSDEDGDVIYYDIYIGEEENSQESIANRLTTVSFEYEELLKTDTQYFWKIKAYDMNGGQSYSSNWSFHTGLPGIITHLENIEMVLERNSTEIDGLNAEDGFINPGEQIKFKFEVTNNTLNSFKKLDVELSSESPYITMENYKDQIKDLKPGETRLIMNSIGFIVSEEAKIGSEIEFMITYSDKVSGYKETYPIKLIVKGI